MSTLADVKLRTLNILGDTKKTDSDPIEGNQYGSTLLLDGACAGADAILAWISKTSVGTLVCDGEETEFDLPADLYRLDGVWDVNSKVFLSMQRVMAGDTWANTSFSDTSFMEWPEGKITFSKAPSTDGIKLYYAAVWGKPDKDTDVIDVPDVYLTAIALYAAAYSLLNKATAASLIRQYNTKTDSGNPEQNPAQRQADYLLKWFESEMNRHPVDLKGQK